MKSSLRHALALLLLPAAALAQTPPNPAAQIGGGAAKAQTAVAAANAKAAEGGQMLAKVQSLIADMKGGNLTAAPGADAAAVQAVAERKGRLIASIQGFAPANAKPTEATTDKFVTELHAALKPTLDSMPADLDAVKESAASMSATDLMNKASAASADPKASLMNIENLQSLIGQVQSVMSNPSMAPADLAGHMDKVTKLLTDLNVAPESVTKVVDSLGAMAKESAALLPK